MHLATVTLSPWLPSERDATTTRSIPPNADEAPPALRRSRSTRPRRRAVPGPKRPPRRRPSPPRPGHRSASTLAGRGGRARTPFLPSGPAQAKVCATPQFDPTSSCSHRPASQWPGSFACPADVASRPSPGANLRRPRATRRPPRSASLAAPSRRGSRSVGDRLCSKRNHGAGQIARRHIVRAYPQLVNQPSYNSMVDGLLACVGELRHELRRHCALRR